MSDFQTEQGAEYMNTEYADSEYLESEYDEPMYKEPRVFEFCRDSLRMVSKSYVGWLIFAGFASFLVYYFLRSSPLGSIRPSIFMYYLIVFTHVVYRFRKNGRANVLSPEILFLFIYTMFHLGYVTLYALGIVPYSTDVFVFETSIPKALFVTNLGLLSFLLGYEILGSRKRSPKVMGQMRIPGVSWCLFGLICMAIGVAAHVLVVAYLNMRGLIALYGYSAFQNIDVHTRSFFWTTLHRNGFQLMLFGLAIYVVASSLRYRKLFKSKLALALVIIQFIFVALEGDRGPIMQLGVPILIVRHYFVKRIRIRYLFLITAVTLLVFTMVGPLVRGVVTMSPGKMYEEFKYQQKTGYAKWTSPFVEMGTSFLVVNITTHEVPRQEPYWKGSSWKSAVFHIVPFFEGYAIRKGWSKWAPSTWITHTYYGPERAGRAFTVAAEGYLNFGYVGVVIELMFFGLFFRWLTMKFSTKPSAVWGIIMLGCIGASMMVIRNHVEIVLYACARITVVAVLLKIFMGEGTPLETEETALLEYEYEPEYEYEYEHETAYY